MAAKKPAPRRGARVVSLDTYFAFAETRESRSTPLDRLEVRVENIVFTLDLNANTATLTRNVQPEPGDVYGYGGRNERVSMTVGE